MIGSRLCRYAFYIAILALSVVSRAQAQTPTVVLFDDFNGPTLNVSTWSTGDWLLGRTTLGKSTGFRSGVRHHVRQPVSRHV